jgi:hypothetical protein
MCSEPLRCVDFSNTMSRHATVAGNMPEDPVGVFRFLVLRAY